MAICNAAGRGSGACLWYLSSLVGLSFASAFLQVPPARAQSAGANAPSLPSTEGPAQVLDTEAGTVLADHDSLPLYVYAKDEPGISNCVEDCAEKWPPFLAAPGASAKGDYSILTRPDGKTQWAYKGRPLYHWTVAGPAEGRGSGSAPGRAPGEDWTPARP